MILYQKQQNQIETIDEQKGIETSNVKKADSKPSDAGPKKVKAQNIEKAKQNEVEKPIKPVKIAETPITKLDNPKTMPKKPEETKNPQKIGQERFLLVDESGKLLTRDNFPKVNGKVRCDVGDAYKKVKFLIFRKEFWFI